MTRPTRWWLMALVLLVAAFPAGAHAKGKAKPKGVAGAPATAQPGGAFDLQVRIAAGRRSTARGTVVVLLSADRKADRRDLRIGKAALRALKRRRATTVRVNARVPATLAPGTRHVIACVASRKGRLGACRTVKRQLAVVAAPAGSGGAGGAGAGPEVGGSGAGGGASPGGTDPGGGSNPGTNPGTNPGGGDPPPGDDPAIPLETPNPRSVTPTTEPPAARTEQRIGPAGGTLTATAADGSTFELTIPADALLSETEIAMTPLASIGGLPFAGGLVAGVELLPHGLRLLEAARLTITPATPLALGEQAPFAYSQGGADFRLFPLTSDPAKLEMTLTHFSGYGVAKGTDAERNAQESRAPADAEAQLEQEAQRLIEQLRESGDQEDFAAEFVDLQRRYYRQVVKPRMQAAETDDSLANLALTGFFGWSRQNALLGFDDEFAAEDAEGWASVERIIANAYAKAFERCKAGQTSEALTMLSIERTRQLLGIGSEGTNVFEDIRQCVRYELDFSGASVFEKKRSSSTDTHYLRTHALVPLELGIDGGEWRLTGEADPEVLEYRIVDTYTGSCPFTPVRTEVQAPLRVRAVFDLNPRQKQEDGRTVVEPPSASLAVWLTDARINETYAYCGTSSLNNFTYNGSFQIAHAGREIGDTAEYLFDRWTALQPPDIGSFENQFRGGTNFTGGKVEFDTEMVLRHNPVR